MTNIELFEQQVSLGCFDFFGIRDYELLREALDIAYEADCRDAKDIVW